MPQISPLPPIAAPAKGEAKDASRSTPSDALPSFLALLADAALGTSVGETLTSQTSDAAPLTAMTESDQPAKSTLPVRSRDRSHASVATSRPPLLATLPIPITIAPLPPSRVSASGQSVGAPAVSGLPIIGGKLLTSSSGATPPVTANPIPGSPVGPLAASKNAPEPAAPPPPAATSPPAASSQLVTLPPPAAIGGGSQTSNPIPAIGMSPAGENPLSFADGKRVGGGTGSHGAAGDRADSVSPAITTGPPAASDALPMPPRMPGGGAVTAKQLSATMLAPSTTEASSTRRGNRSEQGTVTPLPAGGQAPAAPGAANVSASQPGSQVMHPAVQRATDQIVARSVMLQHGQATELHMQLRPPDLGDLSVTLRRDLTGALSVHLVPATGEASNVLAASLHHLGAALDPHSATGHATVTLGQGDAANQHQGQAMDRHARSGGSQRGENAQDTPQSSRASGTSVSRAAHAGGVDYDA